ncbi:DUF6766 family protein [Catellatospora vulcania]|uniref:DUF6766 family protein n=1 Tax=Catellatospora vulcania TaxID=1460450 RepID=UPI002E7C47D5|nr:DUF6766 family protein [Catellatospora vulcania]
MTSGRRARTTGTGRASRCSAQRTVARHDPRRAHRPRSAESKKPDEIDRPEDYPENAGPDAPSPSRRNGLVQLLYRNSLAVVLLGFFLLSFVSHVLGGTADYNEQQALSGQPSLSAGKGREVVGLALRVVERSTGNLVATTRPGSKRQLLLSYEAPHPALAGPSVVQIAGVCARPFREF